MTKSALDQTTRNAQALKKAAVTYPVCVCSCINIFITFLMIILNIHCLDVKGKSSRTGLAYDVLSGLRLLSASVVLIRCEDASYLVTLHEGF